MRDVINRASQSSSTDETLAVRHLPGTGFSDREGWLYDKDEQTEDNFDDIYQPTNKGWLLLFEFTTQPDFVVLSFAIAFSLLSGLILPVSAIIFGDIFNEFSQLGNGLKTPDEFMDGVIRFVIGLTVLGCIAWLTNGAMIACWLWFGELQAGAARKKVFKGLITKEIAWFDSRKDDATTIVPRCQGQVRELQIATSQPLGIALKGISTCLGALGVAFYFSWSLTLVILAGFPFSFLIVGLFSARLQVHIKAQTESMSMASKIVSRAISNIDVVKAFNGQDQELKAYKDATLQAGAAYCRQAYNNCIQIGFIRVIVLSMFVQGFWYGSKLVRDGLSAGAVLATFWASLMAAQSIEMILPNILLLEKGKMASRGLRTILEKSAPTLREIERQAEIAKMPMPQRCYGYVILKQVSFSYPSSKPSLALDRVDLTVSPGEHVFIVGRSGSGKSSLAHLMLGVWEASSGTIQIDDREINTLDGRYIHDNITLVQQQSVLFNETIHRNIAFGRSNKFDEIDERCITAACTDLYLDDVLAKLPHGIDTVVGQGGVELSGGERQRVALARARYRDSPILILDESTSALDEGMRLRVMESIRKWRQGKTTIIITHELSQIQDDDYVYVFDRGCLVEGGKKTFLEQKTGGVFKKLQNSALHSLQNDQNVLEDEAENEISTSGIPIPWPTPQCSGIRKPPAAHSLKASIKIKNRQQLSDVSAGLSPATTPAGRRGEYYIEMKSVTSVTRQPSAASLHYNRPQPRWQPRWRKECPKKKEDTSITLLQIASTLFPSLSFRQRLRLLLGFGAAAMNAACTPAFAFALAKIETVMFVPNPTGSLHESIKYSLMLLGIAVADAITSAVLHYNLENSGQSWINSLRIQSFKLILSQCREWFENDKNKVSRLIEDLITNSEDMRNLLGRFAAYLFVGSLITTVCVLWSFVESSEYTLIGLAAAPGMYAIIRAFASLSKKFEARSNAANEYTGTIFHETIMNFKTVRVLDLENYFQRKYNTAIKNATRSSLKRCVAAGSAFGIVSGSIMFVTALLFYYGAHLVAMGKQSIETNMIVMSLLLFCLTNGNALAALIPQISNSQDTARRLLRLSQLSPTSHEDQGETEMVLDGAISMHCVNFAYPSQPLKPVLRTLSLEIEKGECVAIVGPSGSGKSTISSLLQCMYVPVNGGIFLSRNSIQGLSTKSVRSQMAVVAQTPNLFPATIRSNICYGLPAEKYPTQKEIDCVARAVGIHDWIMSLPKKYDTFLRSGDSSLSGGQAQRISIARALIRRPKILLLDECTSALDSESAATVAETVQRLTASRRNFGGTYDGLDETTVLIITHKQDLMRIAERVMVLGNGEVVEAGTYEELKNTKSSMLMKLLSSDGLS